MLSKTTGFYGLVFELLQCKYGTHVNFQMIVSKRYAHVISNHSLNSFKFCHVQLRPTNILFIYVVFFIMYFNAKQRVAHYL